MLDKSSLYNAAGTLDKYIRLTSNNDTNLLDNIIAYLSSDELNTMFDIISNDWFNLSTEDFINEYVQKVGILLNSLYMQIALVIVCFGFVGFVKGYFKLKTKQYLQEQAALLKWQIELENKASNLRKK